MTTEEVRGLLHLDRLALKRHHFEQLFREVDADTSGSITRDELRKVRTQQALGITAAFPTDVEVLTSLNGQGGTAPGGGTAYLATADDTLGAVGIARVSSGTVFVYTVTRPSYEDYSGQATRTVTTANI